jgi:HYR domain
MSRLLIVLAALVGFGSLPAATLGAGTPPPITIDVQSPIQTTDSSGADVAYTVKSHVDLPVTCSPAGGPGTAFTATAHFPVGTSTITCSDGTNSASANVTVTLIVPDTTPPTLTVPGPLTAEATSPAGAVVSYTVGATDNSGAASIDCGGHPSGSTFPLGTTTVTCTATDPSQNSSSGSFTVTVQDTRPPILNLPQSITVETTSGSGTVVTFSASASDAVSGTLPAHCTPSSGSTFAIGTTTVNCFATDGVGLQASGSFTVTVTARATPPPGTPTPSPTPPLPTPPAQTPPKDVTGLKAEAGDTRVRLSWKIPNGVDHVVVTRELSAGGDTQVVYTGSAESFTDRGLVNGLEYRYVVVSVEKSGNTSAGVAVVALPKATLLRSPKDGASLKKPPKLVWVRNPEARYYNVQVFRGAVKILSSWPAKPALTLKRSWKYQGHKYKLTPGVYRWYVWPGFGARSAADYGDMLGFSTFQIVR